ncbi:MAG TPA: MMPL family transporter [Terriglobales bacterium]|nr:MMPL family transporter [Terriglobales bacterium]
MIPQRWIEAYLHFLLKYKRASVLFVAAITAIFCYGVTKTRLHTDFFDFYPRNHEYIKFYNEFRRMFGSANIMSVIIETKSGDIYNPETLQKIDRVTKYMVATPGVVPTQILSIAHPKVRSFSAAEGTISIREIFYPTVPQTQADAERVRFAVYSNRGVRGVFVSQDDTAAVVHVGFWEEALDFHKLNERMNELVKAETDANHSIHITGFPWLYTSVLEYADELYWVFGLTVVSLSFLLYTYFRTWTGVWVPISSGILSSIWGIGIAAFLGFNLDPLVLVIPIFLTARTLSHSVQSMDRYHEEYYRLKDKHQAIVVSYSHLFAPAIAAIVTDGIGLLIVAVAPIPLIQKVAIFASFWVVSNFISVVTLHPIVLAYIDPPPEQHLLKRKAPPLSIGAATGVLLAGTAAAVAVHYMLEVNAIVAFVGWAIVFGWYWLNYCELIYPWATQLTIDATEGWRSKAVVVLTVLLYITLPIWGWQLKVGNMTPGAALLFEDHPYNVAYDKLNSKFLGASQLIVVVDTLRPGGIKEAGPLNAMEELGDHMQGAEGAGGTITVLEIVKRLASLYHDGDPKWGIVPAKPRDIAELFYFFENAAASGDLDRFMDSSARYGSVVTLFREYSHEIIMGAIERAKSFGEHYASENDQVRFRYAGGLFGILAAVNEEVDGSYWTSLVMIFAVVYWCLYLTYGTHLCSAILMIPVVLSQLAVEAMMVWFDIDLNVNSLPIAAAGAGVGVDYGIYHFSRMIDTYDEVGDVDIAVDYATATTGKAIIFTATTMVAGSIFWWFSELKFQAEMGFLLASLMFYNLFGGLVVVPAFVKLVRPSFLARRRPRHLRPELKELFKNGVRVQDIEQAHIIV